MSIRDPKPLAVMLAFEHPDINLIELMDQTKETAEAILDRLGYHTLHPSFKPLVYDGTLKFHQMYGLSRLKDVEQQALFWDNYKDADQKTFHEAIDALHRWNQGVRFGELYGANAVLLKKMGEMSEEEAQRIVDKFFETYPKLKELYRANL